MEDDEKTKMDCIEWDFLAATGRKPDCPRPFGPLCEGSRNCESGSMASGGTVAYCTCDTCF